MVSHLLVRHLMVSHLLVSHLEYDLLASHRVGDRSLWCPIAIMVSYHLLRWSSEGSNLLWDDVGRSVGKGKSRLVRVNCCHHWGICLRYWVDVAVLVEVLGEALMVDGDETTRGLDEVSMGRGEWTHLGTLVHKALKGEPEPNREEGGQDQLENIKNLNLLL